MREGRLSRAADAYALGVIMWEAWTGLTPFAGMHAASVLYSVGVEGRRPEPAIAEGDAPPGYVSLLTRLWDDSLAARPTAADAARELKAMLDAEPGGGGVPRTRSMSRAPSLSSVSAKVAAGGSEAVAVAVAAEE